MPDPLAPRILNLPDDVRAALARVDGPGWYIMSADRVEPSPGTIGGVVGPSAAWWSGNPAASVAAVTGLPIWRAHYALFVAMDGVTDDDHAAALSIIEAHVANRGSS